MQLGIPEDKVSAVDWDTFKRVCKANPEWNNLWFTKHKARIRPVKYNLVRRKHDDNPTCPCCGALETTFRHVHAVEHLKQQTTHLYATKPR